MNFWGQPKRTRGKGNSLDSFLYLSVLSPESQLGHHLGQASCSSLRAPGLQVTPDPHSGPASARGRQDVEVLAGLGWVKGASRSPHPAPRSLATGDRQTDTDVRARLPGRVREEAEPPGRGGAVEQSSASRPLQRLGLWGDTKSSRSVTSAWRRVSNPGRGGWRGRWKAPPEAKGRTGQELGCGRRRRHSARAAPQPAAGGAGGRRPSTRVWQSAAGNVDPRDATHASHATAATASIAEYEPAAERGQ